MNQQNDFMKNPFKLLTNIYRYDDEKMMMTKVVSKKSIVFSMLTVMFLLLTSFYVGTLVGSSNQITENKPTDTNFIPASKYDTNPEHDMVWKDSVFKDYRIKADLYLNRPIFEGTPLTGEILTLCARNAYDSTGILLPVELALSQGQWESGMGREGKSPRTNPFNIGEHDSGTVLWFNTTFEGTQAYYYYICNDYLRCRSVEELLSNFVNCAGHRYGSGPEYENKIRESYYGIKKWISANRKF